MDSRGHLFYSNLYFKENKWLNALFQYQQTLWIDSLNIDAHMGSALSLLSLEEYEDAINEFNPFEVKRSLGLGIRIFMPMFGILGVDFGHGFDNIPGYPDKVGWQTHFSIGQQF